MTSKKTIVIRILKWTGIVLAVLIALLLLATWFVNTEPFQRKIRDEISRQTRDVLTFGQLKVSLLPRPHITVNNAIITVPGKVSGLIAAAAVYPDPLPLFEGKVSVSRVRLENPDFTVELSEEPGAAAQDAQTAFAETRAEIESAMTQVHGIAPDLRTEVNKGRVTVRSGKVLISKLENINGTISLLRKGFDVRLRAEAARWGRVSINGALFVWKHSISVKDLSISGGSSTLSGLSARFSWRKTPYLDVRSGKGVVVLADVLERRDLLAAVRDQLKDVKKMTGTIRFDEMNFIGPLLHEEQWQMKIAGGIENAFVDSPLLPGPVRIGQGRFVATTKTLSLTGLKAAIFDSTLSGSMALSGSFTRLRSLAVDAEGGIGEKTVQWTAKQFNVPAQFRVRTPLWLSAVSLAWEKGRAFTVRGTAALNKGPAVSIDMRKDRSGLLVKRLVIEDGKERASISASTTKKELQIAFKGKLSENTLNKIFERANFERGSMRGDFRARILYENPQESAAQGGLDAVNLVVPMKTRPPLVIKQIALQANDKTATVNKASFIWEDEPYEAKGRIRAARDGFHIDMDVEAGSTTIESIERAITGKKDGAPDETAGPKPSIHPWLLGTIRFTAKDFTYKRYVLDPVKGKIFLDRNSVRVEVADTKLCGMPLTAHFQPLSKKFLLDIDQSIRGQQLEPVLSCLSPKHRISGTFDLSGKLHTYAKSGDLVRSLQGRIDFTARDGRIYQYPILARILAFLNVTELLRGKLPDLGREGFKYKSIKVKGDISNGILHLRQASVEGATMNIAAEGQIDFASNRMDVTVLVAPFKTIEYIISKIPLLRNILANRLVAIPVRVTGDPNNPDITPLDPKAIGQNLLNIMKGILELPFKIFEPLIRGE